MTMFDTLYLYGRFLSISVRSQMQYRASFVMLTVGHMITTGLEFVVVLVLFDRFGTLIGWTLHEVAFIYGVVNVSFAFADAMSRGFDMFGTMVKSGDFDRLLTRPRSTALQLSGQELTLRRFGRFAQGLAVMIWACFGLDMDWSVIKVGLLIGTVVGGTCLFMGLLVLQATLAFWTTESLEIMNTMTYGGVETTRYPMDIYHPWFRGFFTFVVPLACVSYFPSLAIMGVDDPLGSPVWFQHIAPVIGVGFLMVTLRVWNFGVRHYMSTGS